MLIPIILCIHRCYFGHSSQTKPNSGDPVHYNPENEDVMIRDDNQVYTNEQGETSQTIDRIQTTDKAYDEIHAGTPDHAKMNTLQTHSIDRGSEIGETLADESEDGEVYTYAEVSGGTTRAVKLAMSNGGESGSGAAYAYAEVNRSAVLAPPVYAKVNKSAVLIPPTMSSDAGEHPISMISRSEYSGGTTDEGWVDNSFYSTAGNRGQSKPVYDRAIDTEGWRINSIYSSASGSMNSDDKREDGVATCGPTEGWEDNTIYVSQKWTGWLAWWIRLSWIRCSSENLSLNFPLVDRTPYLLWKF